MSSTHDPSTWWSAVKPDAATDAIWESRIALESACRAAHVEHNDDPAAHAQAGDPAWDGWVSWLPVVRVIFAQAAQVAERWESSLRPGSQERLNGHKEAGRGIAEALRSLSGEPNGNRHPAPVDRAK